MSIKQANRDLIHAQLRLASTDPDALEDAIRYVTRAMGALFDAKAARDVKTDAELVKGQA